MFIVKYPCGEARERKLERVRDKSNMDCVAPMIRKAHYSRTSRPNKHTHFISQGVFLIFGEPRIDENTFRSTEGRTVAVAKNSCGFFA